jgi:hypothetical protein
MPLAHTDDLEATDIEELIRDKLWELLGVEQVRILDR